MDPNSTIRRGASSLYEDQLQMGFSRLRFVDFLEREFRDAYSRENFQKSRLVLSLCSVAVVIVLLLNLVAAAGTDALVEQLALALMAVILLGAIGTSYLERPALYKLFVCVSALTVGIAGAVTGMEASLAGKSYYFAGHIGWLFIIWSMLGLLFATAAGLCAVVACAYLLFAVHTGFPTEQLLFEGFMLLSVNLLGGYSCYKIEYGARRIFLESRILNQLAERDGLTGLYNRRAFDRYMERIWRQSRRESQPVTIVLIDIDHFKAYNDLYGHQAGDDALRSVASVVSSAVQRPLDIAARYGGEEFALVLYGPASDYVMQLPETLRADVLNLGTVHEGGTVERFLSVSVGAAVIPPDSDRSLAGAIQMADEALYQAKHEGRNRVVVRRSGTALIETGRFRTRQAG